MDRIKMEKSIEIYTISLDTPENFFVLIQIYNRYYLVDFQFVTNENYCVTIAKENIDTGLKWDKSKK